MAIPVEVGVEGSAAQTSWVETPMIFGYPPDIALLAKATFTKKVNEGEASVGSPPPSGPPPPVAPRAPEELPEGDLFMVVPGPAPPPTPALCPSGHADFKLRSDCP
uniref:Uncharacterized protein n=1 Tax=Knipowitschia caucasica TaxID=637954 RepID=A0AAV2LM39_KNICA